MILPEDVNDDSTRRALVNEANRLYGWHAGGRRCARGSSRTRPGGDNSRRSREKDPDGRIVVHHRTVDTLGNMLRAGAITPEMHDAAKDFQAAFILPQLVTSRALPILRVPGPGHAPELNDRQLHARRRVHEALEALGRLSSPGARASGTSSACSAPSPRARFGKAGAVARVGRSRRRHPGGGARGAGAHFGHSEAEALLKDPCATLGDRLTVPGRKAEVGVTTTIAARGPEADFPGSSDPLLLQKRR